MSKLNCIRGLNKGDQFTLHEGRNIIGRAREANVLLFDKQTSREHCVIVKKGRHYSVQDLGSRNGTFLNKKKLGDHPQSIKAGDKIKIGKTVLLLSEKGVGGLLDQTASDVAADLQSRHYGKLLNSASRNVVSHTDHQEEETGNTITRFLGKLFRR